MPPLIARRNGEPSQVVLSHRGARKQTYVEKLDPGHLLRDLVVELMFRNASMVDYIFKSDTTVRHYVAAAHEFPLVESDNRASI